MALVLIPDGGRHSSRYFTQHQFFTLLGHQDNQPSSKNHSSLTEIGASGSTNTTFFTLTGSHTRPTILNHSYTLLQTFSYILQGSGWSQFDTLVHLFYTMFCIFSVKTKVEMSNGNEMCLIA